MIVPAMPVKDPTVTPEKAAETAVARHPQGVYTLGIFSKVSSVLEFANDLDVPVASIDLIQQLDQPCKTKDCPFNAIDNNGIRCPAHRRTWYPLPHQKGNMMLGAEFLRSTKNPNRSYNCTNQT